MGFAIEHDIVDTLLSIAIRPRYTKLLLYLALRKDGKLFTDLDAIECCVDDGGVGIVADFYQQRCKLIMGLNSMHNGHAA